MKVPVKTTKRTERPGHVAPPKRLCMTWGDLTQTNKWGEMVYQTLCGRGDDYVEPAGTYGTMATVRPEHVCAACWAVYRREMATLHANFAAMHPAGTFADQEALLQVEPEPVVVAPEPPPVPVKEPEVKKPTPNFVVAQPVPVKIVPEAAPEPKSFKPRGFTPEEVTDILAKQAAGWGHRAIAAVYNVNKSTISRLILRSQPLAKGARNGQTADGS